MSSEKNDDTLKSCVMVTVEVPRQSWMDKYGEHITTNQLVPEVTIEKAVRKAVKEKFDSLGVGAVIS